MQEIPKLEILFKDQWIIVVDKPAGFPVHKTVDPLRPHVQGILEHQLNIKTVLFHRLDNDTTGVLIFGIDPSINKHMTDLFRDRKIKKTYTAVVSGRWPNTLKVETFIKKITGGKYKNFQSGNKKEWAQTHFKTLDFDGENSLVECKPTTGRTHQIRLHCQHVGNPIVGDKIYNTTSNGKRMMLNASKVEFPHPSSRKIIKITSKVNLYK